jgi:hypothetical protein
MGEASFPGGRAAAAAWTSSRPLAAAPKPGLGAAMDRFVQTPPHEHGQRRAEQVL